MIVNLPPVATSTDVRYTIKKAVNSTGSITVNPNGAETIDGDTEKIIAQFGVAMSIISDGTQWNIF